MVMLSVIIPLYNEERTISSLIKKVISVDLPIRKEIVVVDDGSTDKSREIVYDYARKYKNIFLITKKNGGKGSAIKIGLKKAKGNIFIIQDADLEYDPNDYYNLIKPILDGKSYVVYGSRFLKKNKFYFMNGFGNRFLTFFTNILYGTRISDICTCYKVFHKKVKDILVNAVGNRFDWEFEISAKLIRKGYKILGVPISYNPRTSVEGKKIRFKDGIIALLCLLKWRLKKL